MFQFTPPFFLKKKGRVLSVFKKNSSAVFTRVSYKFLSEKNILVYPEKGNVCSIDKEFKGPESFVSSRGL